MALRRASASDGVPLAAPCPDGTAGRRAGRAPGATTLPLDFREGWGRGAADTRPASFHRLHAPIGSAFRTHSLAIHDTTSTVDEMRETPAPPPAIAKPG